MISCHQRLLHEFFWSVRNVSPRGSRARVYVTTEVSAQRPPHGHNHDMWHVEEVARGCHLTLIDVHVFTAGSGHLALPLIPRLFVSSACVRTRRILLPGLATPTALEL